MRTFRNRALLDNAIAYLITQGKTFTYREANELDGFIGWILYV